MGPIGHPPVGADQEGEGGVSCVILIAGAGVWSA